MTVYIDNPYKTLDVETFKKLKTFTLRKHAKEWCTANNIHPLRILKVRTKFQDSYILDMGRQSFLAENDTTENDTTVYASLNYFDLYFTRQDVDSMPLSGDCDDAVQAIAKKPYVVRQFAAIDNSKLVKELSGFGAWDDVELQDKQANIERIIWLACSDIKEREFIG